MGRSKDPISEIVFFDLETTGPNITKDRIVQISCIKGDVRKTTYINPEIPISPEATEVHGITNKMVVGAPTFRQIAMGILDFIGDSDLGGYNSNRFDIPILIEEFGRVGVNFSMEGRRSIDVFVNECERNPRTLSAVYERVTGKSLDEAHDAEADVMATIEIFKDQIKTMDDAFAQPEDRVDCAGKLKRIDGAICRNLGKWTGKPIPPDMAYLNWVLKGDFSKEVKDTLRECL